MRRWFLPLLAALALVLGGCDLIDDPSRVACTSDTQCPPVGWYCPGTEDAPATCSEGERPGDDDDAAGDDDAGDDDAGDDDTSPGDDDAAGDDDVGDDDTGDDDAGDDDVGDDDTSTEPEPPTSQLCAAAGTASNGTYTATTCTGPPSLAPGVSTNGTYTIETTALRLTGP